MMTKKDERLLALIRCVNEGCSVDTSLFSDLEQREWIDLMDTARIQGVLGICFDAIERLPEECRPPMNKVMDWFGQVYSIESRYDEHLKVICKLSRFFMQNKIKTVLLKGYGLSLNYSVPNHRPTGDIDIYHCGLGEVADKMVMDCFGLDVKQNEEKHSTYEICGVHVENHATIINVLEHRSLIDVEKYLEEDLKNNSEYDEQVGCYLPSSMFNAVYLPLHLGAHLVFEGTSLRQVVDYALMIKKHSDSIDWEKVMELSLRGGFYKFICCLNGICLDKLGIVAACVPNWPRYKELEEKVLNEILYPKDTTSSTVFGKTKHFIDNRWKYRLVFSNENYIKGFFLRIRSWLIWKWGLGRSNVWQ